ncbi:RNA-binding domain-containing protein [Xylariomycetidae sp. FL0641]|nr:RNA-binding domain-containing protein [Xylariomycetidae sp. FL0641]
MDSRSPSRERYSRSPTPRSRYSASPRRPSPARSPSPEHSPPRRNGRYRSQTRSPSHDRESRSPLRGSTKIVVEKLSKNINEDHLHEVFGEYGPIRDLDLPMSRQFNTNRGTAYILYVHESDAEAAIAHMHEAQLDGAVINVSIVLPRRKFSPEPPTATRGANIDPRHPAPGFRGGRGPGGAAGPGGRGQGFGGGRQARSPGRFGRAARDSFDTYRPASYSRSRSPAPPRRNRSPSDSYDSRSRSPPRRRGGRRDSPDNYDGRHRSPSYDSYRDRSRSRSAGRGYR